MTTRRSFLKGLAAACVAASIDFNTTFGFQTADITKLTEKPLAEVLRVERLDHVLQNVTFQMEHIQLWKKDLSKPRPRWRRWLDKL